MAKKALVVVQGINKDQGYLYDQIITNKWFNKQYDKIKDVPTETFFDKKTKKGWGSKIMNVMLFGNWDAIGDVWTYYTSDNSRKRVCKATRNLIRELQNDGHDVDIIAHSLGTVITLCSGPMLPHNNIKVKNSILMGSPLGIGLLPLRMKTNSHTERYSDNFYSDNIKYLWSKKDFISKVIKDRIMRIISSKSINTPSFIQTDTDHKSQEYLEYLQE